MATDIVIRTGFDRLRYALLFEGILVVLFTTTMVLLFDGDLSSMGALSVVLSLVALATNFVYNYVYDSFDVRYGRIPTERSLQGRILHAVGFEFTLVILSVPIIVWWMAWGWWQAIAFDAAAMAAIVVYTYFFTLAYDRVFPVVQPCKDGL